MLRKAAVLIIVLSFLAPTIQAADDNRQATDSNDKAIVIDKLECALLASDGATVFMGMGKLVIEKYEVTFSCKGTQDPPYPVKPVRFLGLELGLEYPVVIPSGETYTFLNWKEVITPNGKVTLKGEINLKPHDKEKEYKDDNSEN